MPARDRYLTPIRTRGVLVSTSPGTQYHHFLVCVKFLRAASETVAMVSATVEQVGDQVSRMSLPCRPGRSPAPAAAPVTGSERGHRPREEGDATVRCFHSQRAKPKRAHVDFERTGAQC